MTIKSNTYTHFACFVTRDCGNRTRPQLTKIWPYPLPNRISLIGDTAANAVGQELGQVSSQLTQRQMNIQPTIKIPVGFELNVRVDRDIVFEQPYTPEGY